MKGCISLFGALFAVASLSAASPVAKWDVVPYQRIRDVFNVGVVAFHTSPCKVEFLIDGKRVHTATEPTVNPRTKVREYVFPLDVTKRKDGPLTLTARAVADDGVRELPELVLYADQNETQGSKTVVWVDSAAGNDYSEGTKDKPLKTLKQAVAKAGDGGTIYLQKGADYRAERLGGGNDRKFWTTISPAPGLTIRDIRIKGGRTGTDKLHFKDVQLFCDIEGDQGYILAGLDARSSCWVENCLMSNVKGRHAALTYPFGNKLIAYVTGGATTDLASGPCCRIVRNHRLRKLAADAFSASDTLVVNCQIDDLHASKEDAEPAFHRSQATGGDWTRDVILYNVKGTECWCNGLIGVKLRDSAFVDVSVAAQGGERYRSRYAGEMENVIFRNVTISGQPFEWFKSVNGVGDFVPVDVTIENSSFTLPEKEK